MSIRQKYGGYDLRYGLMKLNQKQNREQDLPNTFAIFVTNYIDIHLQNLWTNRTAILEDKSKKNMNDELIRRRLIVDSSCINEM